MSGPRTPQFEGGAPVTDPQNPFNAGAGAEEQAVLGSLPVEARGDMALTDLNVYSDPITDPAAAERALNPPTYGGVVERNG